MIQVMGILMEIQDMDIPMEGKVMVILTEEIVMATLTTQQRHLKHRSCKVNIPIQLHFSLNDVKVVTFCAACLLV